MTSVEYLMSKKITPVIKVIGESNQSEVFVTMTIRQFEEYAEYCADKAYGDGYTDALRDRPRRNIDTLVKEVCDHHWLPIGEWDGVMMLQCTKCNLYKEGEGKKECVHPYAMVYGGCGKPERCLLCGEILSD